MVKICSNTGVFLRILRNYSEQPFNKTRPVAATSGVNVIGENSEYCRIGEESVVVFHCSITITNIRLFLQNSGNQEFDKFTY